jgi:hypothetical protein
MEVSSGISQMIFMSKATISPVEDRVSTHGPVDAWYFQSGFFNLRTLRHHRAVSPRCIVFSGTGCTGRSPDLCSGDATPLTMLTLFTPSCQQ